MYTYVMCTTGMYIRFFLYLLLLLFIGKYTTSSVREGLDFTHPKINAIDKNRFSLYTHT